MENHVERTCYGSLMKEDFTVSSRLAVILSYLQKVRITDQIPKQTQLLPLPYH
jgi:hypothetical protein